MKNKRKLNNQNKNKLLMIAKKEIHKEFKMINMRKLQEIKREEKQKMKSKKKLSHRNMIVLLRIMEKVNKQLRMINMRKLLKIQLNEKQNKNKEIIKSLKVY